MTTPFQQAVEALAHELDAAFLRAQYAEAAFCQLATEHVERARLHERFDLAELARWALSTRVLPEQHDLAAEFGDPPLTLWAGRRFFVSALLWRSSTTAIHQHAFTGAFQVLLGGSVHARYAFEPARVPSEDLQLGALRCTSIERLERGAVRPIPAAGAGIHALFHLEHPSVSLVVRSYADARNPIQYSYHPPGIAAWDLRREPSQRRACQVARMLAELDPAQAEHVIGELLPELPAFDGFALLRELLQGGELGLALQALSSARPRMDAELADAFEAALRELDRKTYLARRRDAVREPELRYLLAILLNAPTRAHALALAEAYNPGRPGADTIVQWLVELSKVTLEVQVGGRAWEPNVLNLPAPDAASCAALRAALAGEPVQTTSTGPFHDAVRHGSCFAPLFQE